MNRYVRMEDRIARAEEIQLYTENRCDALEKENKLLRTLLKDAYFQAHSEFAEETEQAIKKFFGPEEIKNLFL